MGFPPLPLLTPTCLCAASVSLYPDAILCSSGTNIPAPFLLSPSLSPSSPTFITTSSQSILTQTFPSSSLKNYTCKVVCCCFLPKLESIHFIFSSLINKGSLCEKQVFGCGNVGGSRAPFRVVMVSLHGNATVTKTLMVLCSSFLSSGNYKCIPSDSV